MLVENLVLAKKEKKWGEKKAASAPETEGPLSHQFTPLPTPSSAPNLLCCSRCSSPGFQRAVAPPQGVAESMASSCRNIATLLVVPAEPPTATHLPPLPSQDVQAEREPTAGSKEHHHHKSTFTSSTPTAHQLTLPTDQTDPPTGATLKHTQTAHGNFHGASPPGHGGIHYQPPPLTIRKQDQQHL